MHRHLRMIMFLVASTVFGRLDANAQFPGMGGSGLQNFSGYEGHEMNHNLVLPQVAVGEHYSTSLVLLNLGSMDRMWWVSQQNLRTTGKVYFYKQDGSRLPVSVNDGPAVSEFSFSLDASNTASYDLKSTAPDTSGWALVVVDDNQDYSGWGMMDDREMLRGNRLMATVSYTYKDAGQTLSRVGVIPSMYEMGRFFTSVMPVQSQNDLSTGVAIVNTGAQSASIDLRLRDANGQVLATKQLILQAGNQVARFVPELFETGIPAAFQGFLEINTGDEGVVTMGLLMHQGVLTSIPTMHYGRMTSGMMR